MAVIATKRFRTAPKDVIRIALGSGGNAVEVDMLPPTLEVHEDLTALAAIVDASAAGTLDYDALDMHGCLAVVGNALSRNTGLRKVDADYLESIGFDMEDIADFLALYLYYVESISASKN